MRNVERYLAECSAPLRWLKAFLVVLAAVVLFVGVPSLIIAGNVGHDIPLLRVERVER